MRCSSTLDTLTVAIRISSLDTRVITFSDLRLVGMSDISPVVTSSSGISSFSPTQVGLTPSAIVGIRSGSDELNTVAPALRITDARSSG